MYTSINMHHLLCLIYVILFIQTIDLRITHHHYNYQSFTHSYKIYYNHKLAILIGMTDTKLKKLTLYPAN